MMPPPRKHILTQKLVHVYMKGTAALVIVTKDWKQPKCPPHSEWRNRYGITTQCNAIQQKNGWNLGAHYNLDEL